MRKKILIIVGILFILLQLYRPQLNESTAVTDMDIAKHYTVPENVQTILRTSCYDCHSNSTNYPWYAHVQPIAAWLEHHIDEGKSELNFSEFAKRRIAVQNHKFEEIISQIDEEEMPLPSYTIIHRNAILSSEQKQILRSWATSMMDSLKAKYPADSLVLRRRQKQG